MLPNEIPLVEPQYEIIKSKMQSGEVVYIPITEGSLAITNLFLAIDHFCEELNRTLSVRGGHCF